MIYRTKRFSVTILNILIKKRYVYLMTKIHAFLSFLNDHFNIIILLFYCHCSFGITFHILCFHSVKIRLYSLLLKYSLAIFIFAINPQYFISSEYFLNYTEANIILLQLRGYRAGVWLKLIIKSNCRALTHLCVYLYEPK